MGRLTSEAEAALYSRFGKDSLIALATCEGNIPSVRTVDAYYEEEAFYVLTHALSGKMKQIAQNCNVAISGEWFTAHGRGINLGWFGAEENKHIAKKMQEIFAEWIDNGHNDFEDKNTCILKVVLTQGTLFADGKRYDIDFGLK